MDHLNNVYQAYTLIQHQLDPHLQSELSYTGRPKTPINSFQNLFETFKFFQNFKKKLSLKFHLLFVNFLFSIQFANHNVSHKLLGFVNAQALCIYVIFRQGLLNIYYPQLIIRQKLNTADKTVQAMSRCTSLFNFAARAT